MVSKEGAKQMLIEIVQDIEQRNFGMADLKRSNLLLMLEQLYQPQRAEYNTGSRSLAQETRGIDQPGFERVPELVTCLLSMAESLRKQDAETSLSLANNAVEILK